MNLVLELGSRIDQSLARTSYASQISIVLRINSGWLDKIIEAVNSDSFRIKSIGFLAFDIPDLERIGQDKFNMTFQNAEDRIPVVPCRFYSNPQTSMIQDPRSKGQEAVLVHTKLFLELQSASRYHCGHKEIPVDICSANYFFFRVHVTIWADIDHLCVHIHIRVLGRIWAFARSWLVFYRDHRPKKITAFTAHINIAYDSPGFSSFGHDPCLRIMMVF